MKEEKVKSCSMKAEKGAEAQHSDQKVVVMRKWVNIL
jgi:hypothetical protein